MQETTQRHRLNEKIKKTNTTEMYFRNNQRRATEPDWNIDKSNASTNFAWTFLSQVGLKIQLQNLRA